MKDPFNGLLQQMSEREFWFFLKVGLSIDLLGIMLVGLRLTDLISVSWLWVTAPFWGSVLFVGLLMLVGNLTQPKS